MKTKAFLPAIVFLLASLASCNSSVPKSLVTDDGSVRIIENPDGPLYICDLKAAGDTIDIPLSELVEDCRIVRFETSDEALFKAWWIKDINLPGQINKPKIEVKAGGTLSVVHMPFEEGTPIAFRMDTDGNILSQRPALDYMLAGNFDNEIFSYRNIGTFDFFYTGIDTTFTYDTEANKLIPRFTMNFPGFAQKPIHIYTELPNHILIHYYTWDKGRFTPGGDILVDKMKMSSSQYHLVNDFYGNLPIPNPNNRFNKGRLIFNVEPAALQDMIEAHLASGKCPPEAKAQLKELAATLHENDNNLMFVGKLKR